VLLGAWTYLVLIGLLGLALTFLLRSLIASLAGLLSLVLVVSPMLGSVTSSARFLPDQAGSALYQPEPSAALGPGAGALVLVAWVVAVAAGALVTFCAQDA
jgi:hypothetical protein